MTLQRRIAARWIRGAAKDPRTGDGKHHVGVFIPLPASLAKQYPKKAEDSSPAHVTFFYMGAVPQERHKEFGEILRGFFAQEPGPVRARISEVDYFQTPTGRVAYSKVIFSKDMGAMKDRLRSRLEDEGFEVQDSHPLAYTPHITLAYLDDPHQTWDGETPEGSWTFTDLELWGCPKVKTFTLASRRAAALAVEGSHRVALRYQRAH